MTWIAYNFKPPIIWITQYEFNELSEYSASMPTGTTYGKRWKRNIYWRSECEPEWWMGEYYDMGSETDTGINWYRIMIISPKPKKENAQDENHSD